MIAKFIAENFNSCIYEGEFASELQHADNVPIHRKKDKNDKSNYRSNYSKVHEKLIYNQLYQILKIYYFQVTVDFVDTALSSNGEI